MTEDFGKKLIRFRKKHGLSQEELAAKIGVTRQAVSKWERGIAIPDSYNLIRLAECYGMTLDELLSNEDGDAASPKRGEGFEVLSEPKVVVGDSFIEFENDEKSVTLDRTGITRISPEGTTHESWRESIQRMIAQVRGIKGYEKNEGEAMERRIFRTVMSKSGIRVDYEDGGSESFTWERITGVPEQTRRNVHADESGVSIEYMDGTSDYYTWESIKNGEGHYRRNAEYDDYDPDDDYDIDDEEDDEDVTYEAEVTYSDGEERTPHKAESSPLYRALKRFPIHAVSTAAFFLLGIFEGLWHPGWVVFMAIPIYYSLIDVLFKKKSSKGRLLYRVPFALIASAAYVIAGACFSLWHPGWIIFLTIPLYYWFAAFWYFKPKRAGVKAFVFPYPMLIVTAHLTLSLVFNIDEYTWLLYASIPVYYIAASLFSGRKGTLFALIPIPIYIAVGLLTGIWHPTWLILMLIPIIISIESGIRHGKGFFDSLPLWLIIATAYLAIGFITNAWHPYWLIFLAVPTIKGIVGIISGKKDWYDVSLGGAVILLYVLLGIIFDMWHSLWPIILLIPVIDYLRELIHDSRRRKKQ
ncbi:MAG: helix-turn-helix domain-containing protein [Clostridia bacterium]|nr:helix-turn-helix domain-containing protein [Clostridia bacterium]